MCWAAWLWRLVHPAYTHMPHACAVEDGSWGNAACSLRPSTHPRLPRGPCLVPPLLQGEAKERFNAIQQELSQLSTKYSNNVLDATKAYKKLLTDKADVAGLPDSALGLAAQQAAKEGHEGTTPEEGPWLFTLDFPSFFPVMTHAANRQLREVSAIPLCWGCCTWPRLASAGGRGAGRAAARACPAGLCLGEHHGSDPPSVGVCACARRCVLRTAYVYCVALPCAGDVPRQHHARVLRRGRQHAHHQQGAGAARGEGQAPGLCQLRRAVHGLQNGRPAKGESLAGPPRPLLHSVHVPFGPVQGALASCTAVSSPWRVCVHPPFPSSLALLQALALLESLRSAAMAPAQQDLDDIRAAAAGGGFEGELQQWDVSFWAERLKETKYAISDEELRPYFALPTVLEGLFKLVGRLFGVEIEAADGQAPVWHEDVRFFAVKKDGKPKAFFYLGAPPRRDELQQPPMWCSSSRRHTDRPHPALGSQLSAPPPLTRCCLACLAFQTPTAAPRRSAAARGWTRCAASRACLPRRASRGACRWRTWCATSRRRWAGGPR